jgi:hypothetical protein
MLKLGCQVAREYSDQNQGPPCIQPKPEGGIEVAPLLRDMTVGFDDRLREGLYSLVKQDIYT